MLREADDKKMTLWAIACGVAAVTCVLFAIEVGGSLRSRASTSLHRSGRTHWLDETLVPAFARLRDSRMDFGSQRKILPLSKPAPVLALASGQVKVIDAPRVNVRREDFGFEVPQTAAIYDELPLRRNIGELEALAAADREREARIRRECNNCEEGLEDLGSAAESGRERLVDVRASLVSRGESIQRVARELEFASTEISK
jgi:hypothetical protein